MSVLVTKEAPDFSSSAVLADGSIVYVTNIGQLGTNQQRPQQGVPAERLASFRTKVLDEQAMQAGAMHFLPMFWQSGSENPFPSVPQSRCI